MLDSLIKTNPGEGWPGIALGVGNSQFKVFLDTLKSLRIKHEIHWSPGNSRLPGMEGPKLQQIILDAGHNITVYSTTGVMIGSSLFMFFGGSCDVDEPGGSFMFVLDRSTGEVFHRQDGRKFIASEDD